MALRGAFVLPHPPIAIPEIGKDNVNTMRDTINGMQRVAKTVASLNPDTIIIASPHARGFLDALTLYANEVMHGDFGAFGSPEVSVRSAGDVPLMERMAKRFKQKGIGVVTKYERALDHGVSVPLYYLNKAGVHCKVIVIAPGGFDATQHYAYGKIIGDVLKEATENYVFIASGDLSHKLSSSGPYGYDRYGKDFDARVCDALKQARFKALLAIDQTITHRAAQCGYHSFAMLGGVLDETAVAPVLHSYEGPFGVGYATASYHIKDDCL